MKRSFLLAGVLIWAISLAAFGQAVEEDFKLCAPDGEASTLFGTAIAIDDGVIAVGIVGSGDDNNGGSVSLFDAETGVHLLELLPSVRSKNDGFGWAIAIDEGVVAVGASGYIGEARFSGAVFLFDALTGRELFTLLPEDGKEGGHFGTSVALDGGIVAIGAEGYDSQFRFSCGAYLFDVSTGKQLYKLVPDDGPHISGYGESIDIDDGIVVVGARGADKFRGAVYFFDAWTGTQIRKLAGFDAAEGDYFGTSVAIDDGILAVGAPFKGPIARGVFSSTNAGSGVVYLFHLPSGDPSFKLAPPDRAEGDRFGSAVSLSEGVVAVGELNTGIGSFADAGGPGSAYLFDASTAMQIAQCIQSDGDGGDWFCDSIALDGGVLAVGASFGDGNKPRAGAGYVFHIEMLTE